tara:strand:+ start:476 stop:649 length:174 start_codon:yes stop_codon:yes gene_type:complete
MDLTMRLALILIGFVLAMLGMIIAIHADFVVGLLLTFGGCFITIQLLPTFRRTNDSK